jgi:hypothetical protein
VSRPRIHLRAFFRGLATTAVSAAAVRELPPAQAAAVRFIETEPLGLFDKEDAEIFYEGTVPGSGIVALAIEHVWAIDLANAIVDAGVADCLVNLSDFA